ncbi:MAG TPA: PepSY-associated TM helix domain-containing protein [Vicinamibacterales bacterium]|nr:PepSY-associated TM helix domain-containing protein [Vicinamibacterales bacterium]
MKSFRTAIFWIHLSVGALAGIVIFIMSVTGVALTYEKQVIEWADRRAWAAPAGAAVHQHLSPEALLAAATEQSGAAASAITLRADAAAPATVTLDGNKALLVDPYTGTIIGEPPATIRSFFRTMTTWHRYVALEGASRATGKFITGVANLGFLFLVLSGVYLWFPRIWKWTHFRNVLWFRGGLAAKARDFNWHNTIGFWSCVPLAIIVAGVVPISFSWGNKLVYRLAGETPPPPAAAAPARAGESKPQTYVADGLNASWSTAVAAVPAWRTITSRLATNPKAPIVLTVDEGYGGQPQKRHTMTFDRGFGTVVKDETFESLSAGRRARSWLRFAHTGEFYGLTGQTIAGLASAGGVFLVYTGLALATRRLAAFVKRSKPTENVRDSRRAA